MSDFHNIQSHGEQSSRHSAVPPLNTGKSTQQRVNEMIRKNTARNTIERVKRNAKPIQKHRKLHRKAPEAVHRTKPDRTAPNAPLADSKLAELKKLLAIEQR
jgi:hypothetical protein